MLAATSRWTVIVPIPKVLLDASLKLLLDPGMIKLGIDLVRARYGTEWTILDGQGQFGSVRARFTLAAPPGVYPDWVLLTLQHDDGRRMVAHVSYGEKVLLRLPDGHFQVLALFLARKLHQAHKPPLLAVAHTYRGLFIGKQRVVNLYGRIPGPADIATVLSARPEHLLPFTLPHTASNPLLGAAAQLQLPSRPNRGAPNRLFADTPTIKPARTAQTPQEKPTPPARRLRATPGYGITPQLKRGLIDPALAAKLLADAPKVNPARTTQTPQEKPTPPARRLRATPGYGITPQLKRGLIDPALAAKLLADPKINSAGTAQTPGKGSKRKKSKPPPA